MRYVSTLGLLIMLFYILSFSRYNWVNNNKLAAIGSAIIGAAAFALSIFAMFFGNYEM